MANRNWSRWILASLATNFKSVADSQRVPALVEGIDERTAAFVEAPLRAEVRITGPFFKELSQGYFQAIVDVNILLTARFDIKQNAYNVTTVAGVFQEALDQPIQVWNYGGEPGDFVVSDPTTKLYIGYLLPQFGKTQRALHFGQVDTVDHVRQTEVEARYLIELQE